MRGPSADEWIEPITAIIHPRKPFHELGERDRRDMLHLATHKLHKWDYFVTNDKQILERADQLWAGLEIRVATPLRP